MKIKFNKPFLMKTGEVPAGKEIEIDDALAKSYIKNGYAVATEEPKKTAKKKTKSSK